MKTSIELPQAQAEALEHYCHSVQTTPDEVVSQALAQFLPKVVKTSRNLRQHQAFGHWQDKHQDGLVYQHQLRAEWDS
ncbi:MAG: hypothetical protein SVR94_02275 [Pseudomonadota bacterium]|nr:hypothetical protein [Pseudomonadota bacterium]